MLPLKKGDKVGIVSSAGFINSLEDIQLALDFLQSQGLMPVLGKHVLNQYLYMAGTDEERAQDINDFFADNDIKAIFTTAGGCGSQRVLPLLNYELIKHHPKPIFGLSDNTSLQNGVYAQTKCPSVTGFSLKYDFRSGKIFPLTKMSLLKVLNAEKQIIRSGETLRKGVAEGIFIGGCFSSFRTLFGTKYMPSLAGKILLLEDVSEKSYKISLMLTQLCQQKDFDKIAGFVFGNFNACDPFDPKDGTVDDFLDEFVSLLPPHIPVIKNFEYGHIPDRYVLPIGEKVRMDANACTLEYL